MLRRYRVWHITEQKMYYPGQFRLKYNRDQKCYVYINPLRSPESPRKVIIMSSLCKNDKNGKEIFEGDIVDHAPHMKNSDYVKKFKVNPYWEVVRWSDKWLQWEGLGRDEEGYFNPDDLEVVTNIYEQPNLLP